MDQLADMIELNDNLSGHNKISELVVENELRINTSSKTTRFHDFVRQAIPEYFEEMEVYYDAEYLTIQNSTLYDDMSLALDLEVATPKEFWFHEYACLLANKESNLYLSSTQFQFGASSSIESVEHSLDAILKADTLYHSPSCDVTFFHKDSGVYQQAAEGIEKIKSVLSFHDTYKIRLTLLGINLTDTDSRLNYEQCLMTSFEDPNGYELFDGRFDELRFHAELVVKKPNETQIEKKFHLILPVMFETSQVGFIRKILKETDPSGELSARYIRGARTCEDLFPDLYAVAGNLRSTSFTELEIYLAEQRDSGSGNLEILGLSISTGLISIWGVIVMLTIQFYFCVHYGTLVNRCRELGGRPNYPWIGTYRTLPARMLFYISLLLPTAVCFALLVVQPHRYPFHTAVFISISCLLLVWLLWVCWNQRRIPDAYLPPAGDAD